MERTPVNSGDIEGIGYDEKSRILEIEFEDGSIIQYSEVPPSEHQGIMNAASKMGYLQANIEKRYPFVQL